jgi:hypothetical protein
MDRMVDFLTNEDNEDFDPLGVNEKPKGQRALGL